jgi:hypothetical protein
LSVVLHFLEQLHQFLFVLGIRVQYRQYFLDGVVLVIEALSVVGGYFAGFLLEVLFVVDFGLLQGFVEELFFHEDL